MPFIIFTYKEIILENTLKYTLLLIFSLLAFTSQANDSFTIYLARHAEKQAIKDDPKLTECGTRRAEQLASMLEKANIKRIYSTAYKRTMATAEPIATQQKLVVQQYSPAKLAPFAQQLLSKQENALVVGHSNTTPQLAALLSELKVADITEKEYRHLYQIQVSNSGKTLTLLTLPFTCH